MQTFFDVVDKSVVKMWADTQTPDECAADAHMFGSKPHPMPVSATTAALAAIRARGNWMLVNGHWYRRSGVCV